MKEHPILFSGPMVRAILDGRKTQTRRVVKPQPKYAQVLRDGRLETCPDGGFDRGIKHLEPKWKPGDRLWVRETCLIWQDKKGQLTEAEGVVYSGEQDYLSIKQDIKLLKESQKAGNKHGCWKVVSAIHMPRWASRITLEAVSVRVERVQEISEDDCVAEGLKLLQGGIKAEFRVLWDDINKKRGFSWDTNPWVWVIEFRRI